MSHAAIVVAATGELTETQQFPATEAGMNRAISWAARRTDDDLATLWVIEGVATCDAQLAAAADRAGYEVVEAARMDARAQRGSGKSDPFDAHRIAAAVLPLRSDQLRYPRSTGSVRAALRIVDLNQELVQNRATMIGLIRSSKAAELLNKIGVGPVTAGVVYAA